MMEKKTSKPISLFAIEARSGRYIASNIPQNPPKTDPEPSPATTPQDEILQDQGLFPEPKLTKTQKINIFLILLDVVLGAVLVYYIWGIPEFNAAKAKLNTVWQSAIEYFKNLTQ